MTFEVRVNAARVARAFEESPPEDQAELLNEIGDEMTAVMDADIDPGEMEVWATSVVTHLNPDGRALILALASQMAWKRAMSSDDAPGA